ncbi:MAG: DUF4375 domain-containing protein [Armatimonadota bacterium]|nr:MAG: DUF4375 domain-containing protein [Armatimonadota bacterium]
MHELPWLDGYSEQSTDDLIALEGKYRIDSLVAAFEEALGRKAARVGTENLTDEESIILAVEALEREVNNGGYGQFFANTSNEFAPIIVDALTRIGCPKVAALTQDAINTLGIQGPVAGDAIDRAMAQASEERDDELAECDDRYFESAGDLSIPLFEFIRNNRDAIRLT